MGKETAQKYQYNSYYRHILSIRNYYTINNLNLLPNIIQNQKSITRNTLNMADKFHIDSLDKKILTLLTKDARIPFLEVARRCKVSGAAIHQRVKHLLEARVISGTQFNLNPKGLGYLTCAYIGIQVNLTSTSTHEEVFNRIRKIPEIVECHHITGKYSLLIKIYARNNEHLKSILVENIQSIPEITLTETFISLEEGFDRQVALEL